MKFFVKTLFIFFTLMISFCLNPQMDIASNVSTENSIQNSSQKIVFVSNTIRGGEIFSEPTNNSSGSVGNNNFVSNIFFNNDKFSNNKIRFTRDITHKISANLKTEISVRAP